MEMLKKSDCWLMDGTFYVVPSILRQLFSIHGRIENQTVSLIFCLMTKNKASYSEFFYELHRIAADLNITFKPKQSDFERTIFLAVKEYFPETHCQGCIFHFRQNIWRQVQKSKLAVKHGNEEEFSLQIRMIKSLAFVAPECV